MPEKNEEHSSQDRQTGRVWVAALSAALLVISVAVVLLASGRDPGVGSAGGTALARGRSPVALLRRIPQSVNALGSSAAPVTLRFFGDLQCPTSRAFTLEMLPSVIDRWVRTGRLRIEYRALRTATASAKVFMAQQAAALAAGMQGKLWDYIEFFYHEQRREDSGYVNRRFLRSLAEQTPGLDVRQWNGDREETSLAARVALDEQAAARRGLYETPALLIGLTPGRKGGQQGFTPVAPTVLSPAIEGLLGERPRRSSVSASERSGPGRVKVAYRPASGPSRSGGRVAC